MNKTTAAFVMPVNISGSEMEIRHIREAIDSIKNQTDSDWMIIMVDDKSDDPIVYKEIDAMKAELKDKLHVIYSDERRGPGDARNKAVKYAYEIGVPFILYLDADDLSDPRRLELVRKAFDEDETINVVYTSFDVIDENGDPWSYDEINPSIKEIIDGHTVDIVEGECAWTMIASKKKYTNLTSCTAVKTSLAYQEPFPSAYASEDSNAWFRYGAHPGKFHLIKEIKGGYRIRKGIASRSRSQNVDFYLYMLNVDTDGFEKAMEIAKEYGTMGGWDENDLRVAFNVRLALSLLHGGSEKYCKIALSRAKDISKEKTMEYIEQLYCLPEYKAKMREIAAEA